MQVWATGKPAAAIVDVARVAAEDVMRFQQQRGGVMI